jgi:hypothetical protein
MYKARRIAKVMIQGKEKLQYNRLLDYCETVQQMNRGSCVMMKVDRPLPDHPTCFHRLYFFFAAMKKGFRAGCKPIIGLDGFFLRELIRDNFCLPFRGMAIITCTKWHLQLLRQKPKTVGYSFLRL